MASSGFSLSVSGCKEVNLFVAPSEEIVVRRLAFPLVASIL